jgi:hypothetical protein
MRVRNLPLALLCCTLFNLPANAASEKIFYAEAGTMNGFGVNAGFGLHHIAPKFPVGFDFSAGYVFQSDPGNAVEARKIFINDATGGNNNIVESGTAFFIGVETTVEYFFNTQLKGHGFFYNANNQDDNPRNNYRYGDADAAINQPLFYPRVQLLLGYKL